MHYVKLIIITILLPLIPNFCSAQIKFNKEKWLIKDGINFPHRKEMLTDLLDSNQVRGLKKLDILELLGESENMHTQDKVLYYPIVKNLDEPIRIISLAIILDKNDLVESFEIIDSDNYINQFQEVKGKSKNK